MPTTATISFFTDDVGLLLLDGVAISGPNSYTLVSVPVTFHAGTNLLTNFAYNTRGPAAFIMTVISGGSVIFNTGSTFQDRWGWSYDAPGCTTCAAGRSAAFGATACTGCASGTYAAVAGAASCGACPIGQYSAGPENTGCATQMFSCPAGASGTTAKAVTFSGTSSDATWAHANPFHIDR